MKHFLPVLILIVFTVLGCKKDEDIDTSPKIEFQSISQTEVVQFDNSVIISISYIDADGDLGEPDPDDLSLEVKDARLSESDWYHIPPVTPELQELNVEGVFSVELNPLFLLGNGTEETTSFSVQVRDRAGNLSNTIVTPEVLITDSI